MENPTEDSWQLWSGPFQTFFNGGGSGFDCTSKASARVLFSTEQFKQIVAQIVLHYFNKVLFSKNAQSENIVSYSLPPPSFHPRPPPPSPPSPPATNYRHQPGAILKSNQILRLFQLINYQEGGRNGLIPPNASEIASTLELDFNFIDGEAGGGSRRRAIPWAADGHVGLPALPDQPKLTNPLENPTAQLGPC